MKAFMRPRTLLWMAAVFGVSYSITWWIHFFIHAHRAHLQAAKEQSRQQRVQAQQAAVKAITEAGGRVHYEWEFDAEGNYIPDPLERKRSQYATPVGTDGVWRVYEVEFPHAGTDELLQHIRFLPDLRSLNLAYCFRISDAGMPVIAECRDLRKLWLYRNNPRTPNNHTDEIDLSKRGKITDKSLEFVARLEKLQELELCDNDFTDAGLVYLKSMRSLRKLGIRDLGFTDAKINELAKALSQCEIMGGRVIDD